MSTSLGLKTLKIVLVIAIVVLAMAQSGATQAQGCQYVLGFATLHSLIPDVVGACVTNERHDGLGNGYQTTVNGLMQWRKSDNWTAFTNGYQTWINGPTGIARRLNTERFAWEANLEGLPFVGPGPYPNAYYDDRSTPQSLMLSFVNALNRKEYLRAYSYWEPSAQGLPTWTQFQQQYRDITTVQITIGTVGGDAGAGQLYYAVPVTLSSQTTSGQTQTFVGCYVLHLSSPATQGAPPFAGLRLRSATGVPVSPGADIGGMMQGVCAPPLPNAGPIPPLPTYAPGDIGAARYLDDRSNGVQTLRSLFNAINRKEYVRAYSYWEPNAPGLAAFDIFQQGYANTQSVQLTTGAPITDVGAGQLYYSVPVIVRAQTTGGTQEFVGCYRLHLGSPTAQGVPPYRPLGIQSATLRQIVGFGLPQIDTLCR